MISSETVFREDKIWSYKCLTDVDGNNIHWLWGSKDRNAIQDVEKASVEKGTSLLAKIVNYCEELIRNAIRDRHGSRGDKWHHIQMARIP